MARADYSQYEKDSAVAFSRLIHPSLFVCRFYGLIPYKRINGKILKSKFWRRYCIFLTSMFLLCSMFNLYIYNVSPYIAKISTWMLQANCFFSLADFIILSNNVFGLQVLKILQHLSRVTSNLPLKEITKISQWIKWMNLLLYVSLMLHFPNIFSGNSYNIISKAICVYAIGCVFLLDFQYISYVFIIANCFKYINKELTRLKNVIFTEKAHLLRRVYHSQYNPLLFIRLRQLKFWHYELNDLIRKINSTFNLQIIGSIIMTFTELTFSLYFYIYDIRNKKKRNLNNEAWFYYYQSIVLYFSVKIILLTLTCQFANDENSRTRAVINEMIINTNDKAFREEVSEKYKKM